MVDFKRKVEEVEDVADVVDPETGEVHESVTANQLAQLAGLSKSKMLALIRKGEKADEAAFEERERDFWKPGQEGEPTEMRGVYLGATTVGEGKTARRQHAFGTESKRHAGKPMVWRMNGSAALNSQLQNFEPGTFLLLKYTGKEGTVDGYKAKMFDVRPLYA